MTIHYRIYKVIMPKSTVNILYHFIDKYHTNLFLWISLGGPGAYAPRLSRLGLKIVYTITTNPVFDHLFSIKRPFSGPKPEN